jgi:uncharacterized protein
MQIRSENALIFMAKWPQAGHAKTRLAPPLSIHEAAEMARCFLLDTLDVAAKVDADRWIAFAPAASSDDFRRLVGPEIGLIPAEFDSFGDALQSAQKAALAMGYRRASLVASDLPHLDAGRYLEAFEALKAADVALGPCADGGYYLLAAERETPSLFRDIAWSTSTVFEETLCHAAAAGLRVAELPECSDVDTAADLAPVFAELAARRRPSRSLDFLQHLQGAFTPIA